MTYAATDNKSIAPASAISMSGSASLLFRTISLHNAVMAMIIGNVTGNVTGTASQLETNATGANLTLSGNLGVGGTITYEDVARIDATGISTFREGYQVGPLAGIALTAYKDGSIRTTGIITATTVSVGGSITAGNKLYGDGSALTGLASREIYGFTGIGSHLQLTYSNNGADNISGTDFAAFEDEFIGPSGITWSINNNGNLIATI